MDATILNVLRDPAGVPFFPVVFQGLYILTWALHAAFVLLAIGSFGLSLIGSTKQKHDSNWKILTPHLIQTGKLSISLLILLGIAPLLFTQVIYDAGWYVANTLSGAWVFIFIYALIVAYLMFYWYYYANKRNGGGGTFVGLISFLIVVFCGILMHNFAVISISTPDQWMEMYAPGGVVDSSGLNLAWDVIRLAFLVSLSIPVLGIFLQNYSDFVSTKSDYSADFVSFTRKLGTKLAVVGLLISAVLFVLWMMQENLLMHPVSLLTIVSVVILLLMTMFMKNSYITTLWLVVVALFISGIRELIRYNIMSGLGYDLYGYPVNLEIPTIVMFLSTFVILGFTGIAYILTMAWKVGKLENGAILDGTKSVAVTKLGNITLALFVIWMLVYFAWGMIILFKNTL
jgi:hypothetical protein